LELPPSNRFIRQLEPLAEKRAMKYFAYKQHQNISWSNTELWSARQMNCFSGQLRK
jgi:hypothetical protein